MIRAHPSAYVGTPYAELDCFALVREVALKCYGIVYPKLEEYSPTPRAVTASALTDPRWVEVPIEQAHMGDVMSLSPTDQPAGHVGIIIGGGWVLHNDKKYGCIIQSAENLHRRGFKFRKVYRWAP